MNSINRELQDYRIAIEHYNRILKEDIWISLGELEDDGRPKLSNEDKEKIKEKIKGLEEKREKLLSQDKDLCGIIY